MHYASFCPKSSQAQNALQTTLTTPAKATSLLWHNVLHFFLLQCLQNRLISRDTVPSFLVASQPCDRWYLPFDVSIFGDESFWRAINEAAHGEAHHGQGKQEDQVHALKARVGCAEALRRSEERRVGKEGVSTCRSRVSQYT